jgi:hypothetical protein
MPNYTFELRDGAGGVRDHSGVDLANREQALEYAQGVAGELMDNCQAQTRSWRLDVYAEDGKRIHQIPFVSIDKTLDYLRPQLRASVEIMCDRRRSLSEVIHTSGVLMCESRALLALSRGRPYLAAQYGRRTIRSADDDTG